MTVAVLNRRKFMQHTIALGGAALLSATASAEDSSMTMPIIDTHQHLWDLDKFRLPWLERNADLKRSYRMDDYLRATAELDRLTPPARVVKTVYMEVDVAPEQQSAEAEYVLAICQSRQTPMVAAVISGRPASDGFASYIKPFKGSPFIKGVRQVLHGPTTPAGYCLDKAFCRGIQLLGELGMSYDLCMRRGELLDGAKLIDLCPGTHFILDHCGNADVREKDRSRWQKDIAAVAQRPNVVCKISGIVASAKPEPWTADDLAPIINHTLDVFGPDRVMFGGDWPVCTLAATYRQWVEALQTIVKGRKEDEQRKLFHDNAAKFYGIS